MDRILNFARAYQGVFHIPSLRWPDVAEIIIIAFLVYQVMLWIKNTRAWSLVKGFGIIIIMVVVAAAFHMTTILWIAQNVLGLAVIAMVVVLQPELRRALEQLGRKNFFAGLIPFDMGKASIGGRFSDNTIKQIADACYDMGKVRTGALIVLEREQSLEEYERTGIVVDGVVSKQLLINIFEHNTPLHDGAVVVRCDRITSATCYLPLSANMDLSKELGTRHRAGLGISEITDSMTVIVSEETGRVSVAFEGVLYRNLSYDELVEKISGIQDKTDTSEKKHMLWRGRSKHEKRTDG